MCGLFAKPALLPVHDRRWLKLPTHPPRPRHPPRPPTLPLTHLLRPPAPARGSSSWATLAAATCRSGARCRRWRPWTASAPWPCWPPAMGEAEGAWAGGRAAATRSLYSCHTGPRIPSLVQPHVQRTTHTLLCRMFSRLDLTTHTSGPHHPHFYIPHLPQLHATPVCGGGRAAAAAHRGGAWRGPEGRLHGAAA